MCGVDLKQQIKEGAVNESNIEAFIEWIKSKTKNNIFVVSGKGFNKLKITSTIKDIKDKFGKEIKIIICDGITQMDNNGLDEIKATIYNTEQCKLIAAETNTVFLGLYICPGMLAIKFLEIPAQRLGVV
jgi:replicative DNA helicase